MVDGSVEKGKKSMWPGLRSTSADLPRRVRDIRQIWVGYRRSGDVGSNSVGAGQGRVKQDDDDGDQRPDPRASARRLQSEGNRGGPSLLRRGRRVYDPDLPEDSYRGREALDYLLRQMLSGAERTRVLGFDLLPAGDRVVALLRTYSRGEGGAPEVEVWDAHTMTFRNGKITYWRLYLDRVEALTDAGLDPELAQHAKT